jgi:hypothetical protein
MMGGGREKKPLVPEDEKKNIGTAFTVGQVPRACVRYDELFTGKNLMGKKKVVKNRTATTLWTA